MVQIYAIHMRNVQQIWIFLPVLQWSDKRHSQTPDSGPIEKIDSILDKRPIDLNGHLNKMLKKKREKNKPFA